MSVDEGRKMFETRAATREPSQTRHVADLMLKAERGDRAAQDELRRVRADLAVTGDGRLEAGD